VAITLLLQLLDLHPQLFKLPGYLAGLQGPQQHAAEIPHGIGHLDVHAALADLIDGSAQKRRHVRHACQRHVGLALRQNGSRLAASLAACASVLFLLPRGRRIMERAVVRPTPGTSLASPAIGLEFLTPSIRLAHRLYLYPSC
jgi:hypothetical protein